MELHQVILALVLSYLVGSIPSAVIISKGFLKDDVRHHGSGNPGSSNMMRTFGLKFGMLTLFFDMLKGVLGTLIAIWILGRAGAFYGLIAAVLGHNWSIFLMFRGGKGVATTLGGMLLITPWWTLGACALFIIVLLTTRYFAVASLAALLLVGIGGALCNLNNSALVITYFLLVVMSFYRHRENLHRLRHGEESKLGH